MKNSTDLTLELITLIAALLLGVMAIGIMMQEWSNPLSLSYVDKTMQPADLSVYSSFSTMDSTDVVLSFMIIDEEQPYPKSIRINDTPVVDFTADWYTRRTTHVNQMYSSAGDWKLVTLINKNIADVSYVLNNGDHYWHYVIN